MREHVDLRHRRKALDVATTLFPPIPDSTVDVKPGIMSDLDFIESGSSFMSENNVRARTLATCTLLTAQ